MNPSPPFPRRSKNRFIVFVFLSLFRVVRCTGEHHRWLYPFPPTPQRNIDSRRPVRPHHTREAKLQKESHTHNSHTTKPTQIPFLNLSFLLFGFCLPVSFRPPFFRRLRPDLKSHFTSLPLECPLLVCFLDRVLFHPGAPIPCLLPEFRCCDNRIPE